MTPEQRKRLRKHYRRPYSLGSPSDDVNTCLDALEEAERKIKELTEMFNGKHNALVDAKERIAELEAELRADESLGTKIIDEKDKRIAELEARLDHALSVVKFFEPREKP